MALQVRQPRLLDFRLRRHRRLVQLRTVAAGDRLVPRVHDTKPQSLGNVDLGRQVSPLPAERVLAADPAISRLQVTLPSDDTSGSTNKLGFSAFAAFGSST